MDKILTVCSYGTRSYLYTWEQCVKRIVDATLHYEKGNFIFSTDESSESYEAEKFLKEAFRPEWNIHILRHKMDDSSTHYKKEAQLRIAILQGNAFQLARKLDTDLLWSVESDILVDPLALKMSEWVLEMPDNHYDVAMISYPNISLLGGLGSNENEPMADDYLPHERRLPKRLLNLYNKCKEKLDNLSKQQPQTSEEANILKKRHEKEWNRFRRLKEKTKHYPPDGTIWDIISRHGWRRRSWLEMAYPGLIATGCGCLSTDWVGLGCTLLSKNALQLSNFDGYAGEGTQDIFLVVQKWGPKKINMAVIPHVLCDHIKPKRDEKGEIVPGEYTHWISYHEKSGEFRGHLRVTSKPWEPL